MSEAAHQAALFQMARRPDMVRKYPGLDLLEGSMNGVYLTPLQAIKARRSGMLKGAPDIRLPVARNGFNGLAIELKHGKNVPTPEQLAIADRLRAEGYFVAFVWNWTDAWSWIVRYLGRNVEVTGAIRERST